MSSSMPWRVNAPTVASQTLDDESVIINFTSGMYYTTDAMGAMIWELLERGTTAEVIVAHVRECTTGSEAAIRDGVATFLEILRAEELIVPAEGATTEAPPAPENRGVFAAPVLEKFTDMADILLLDPVHEIEDRRHTL